MSERLTVGPAGLPSATHTPTRIVRELGVVVHRLGDLAYLRCGGCGRAGDLEREMEDLAVTGIAHATKCPVRRALWSGFMSSKFNENGRPRRRWKTATIGGAA